MSAYIMYAKTTLKSAIRFLTFRSPKILHTCIDCHTAEESINLLELISSHYSNTDDIMSILVSLYKRFVPYEKSLQHLSLLLQKLQGTGGKDEYAVCTVFSAMTISLCESSTKIV